ncbi:MAG: NAD(P)/FAD-dependent oxidoreductase [Candidatus Zixiibacteriota bacterium]
MMRRDRSNLPFDVAVAGLGPAGIAAATELVRYGWRVVAFECARVGGLACEARRVENAPLVGGPCPGDAIVDALRAQLMRFAPTIIKQRLHAVTASGGWFRLTSETGDINTWGAILATGTSPRRLGLSAAGSDWVQYRWTDLRKCASGRVAVVGGGDLAVDQALSLADAGFTVELLVRSVRLRCNSRLATEAKTRPLIRVRYEHETVGFRNGTQRFVECRTREGIVCLPVDHVLVSIGRDPQIPPVATVEGRNIGAKMILDKGIPGLFAAGDVTAGLRRQIAIAYGQGLDAAMCCDEYLREEGH